MKDLPPEDRRKLRSRSRLVYIGRDSETSKGFINVPTWRGSTVLFPSVASFRKEALPYTYGTHATPTTAALTGAWSELSGAAGTILTPSGLSAIGVALMSALSAGDHLLMTDAAYPPARDIAAKLLKRMGVETTFYDPAVGAGIAALMRDNTRAVFVEAPGSGGLEMQDIPAIAAAAHARGDVCVIADNTWATPLFCQPHALGADLVIEAGTKYLSGHADLLIGLVSGNEKWFRRLYRTWDTLALLAGPDEVTLALRGLRTMELRLREAEKQALHLAHWLAARPEVLSVVHPAMPDYPGHDIWKRDFTGSSGLFSIVLKPVADEALTAMLDGLTLFGLGYSWGGYESLLIPFDCTKLRTATRWAPGGPTLRFSVGLEDIEDLKEDLDRGFERLRDASPPL